MSSSLFLAINGNVQLNESLARPGGNFISRHLPSNSLSRKYSTSYIESSLVARKIISFVCQYNKSNADDTQIKYRKKNERDIRGTDSPTILKIITV